MIRSLPLFLLAAALPAAGCGSAGLVPVSGTVNYKGAPLKTGTIAFVPEKGRPSYGKIVDGKIVDVTTFQANDGVPPGAYKVQIESRANAGDMYAKQHSLIPQHYADPERSKLNADVKRGMPPLAFELQ